MNFLTILLVISISLGAERAAAVSFGDVIKAVLATKFLTNNDIKAAVELEEQLKNVTTCPGGLKYDNHCYTLPYNGSIVVLSHDIAKHICELEKKELATIHEEDLLDDLINYIRKMWNFGSAAYVDVAIGKLLLKHPVEAAEAYLVWKATKSDLPSEGLILRVAKAEGQRAARGIWKANMKIPSVNVPLCSHKA